MSQSEKPFTVSDRRHFTPEGRPREEAAQDEASREQSPRPEPDRTQSAQAPPGEGTDAGASDHPAEFAPFLLGLAAQAGQLIAGQGLPEGTSPEQALTGAREIISILEMLKGKTEGRRTPDEDALLSELLFELRMAYVGRTRAGKP
jgi:hypothetical protein